MSSYLLIILLFESVSLNEVGSGMLVWSVDHQFPQKVNVGSSYPLRIREDLRHVYRHRYLRGGVGGGQGGREGRRKGIGTGRGITCV